MEIKDLRNEIDKIDGELTALFKKRMETAAEIAAYKKENNLPVFNKEREREVLNTVTDGMPSELQGYTKTLYETIFNLSRSYQKRIVNPKSKLSKMIEEIQRYKAQDYYTYKDYNLHSLTLSGSKTQ